MGRKNVLWVLIVLLVGCTVVPEGSYVAYQGVPPVDSTVIATAVYQDYTLFILDKAPYAPTQETGTFVTATSSFQKCEVRAGLNVKYYDRPVGTALGLLETGQTYFPLEVDENLWIRLDVGWVIISDQFPFFDNEACMDMVPPPLIITATSFPTPTPIQTVYICSLGDFFNVREEARIASVKFSS